MKEKKEKINFRSLAPIFVCEKELEEEPLTFRGQPHVNLIIDFEEYVRFVVDTPEAEPYLLSSVIHETVSDAQHYTRTRAEIYRKRLQKAFMLDMAGAILKEAWYADTILHKSGTWMTPVIQGVTAIPISRIFTLYSINNIDYSGLLNKFLTSHNYSPIMSYSENNLHLWIFANVLTWFAIEQDEVCSFIINT